MTPRRSVRPAIAFSVGNDDYWDVKLSISGSMGDAGYDIRIGHIGEHNAMVADPGMPAMFRRCRGWMRLRGWMR